MPDYFAIGFVGILACVGTGLEFHRQSVSAGVPLSEFGPSMFVASIKENVTSALDERQERIVEAGRVFKWQGEMKKHLPEAPEGWTRRSFDEGDNSAVVPVGATMTRYGKEHPLRTFISETWENTKNMKHIDKADIKGQTTEDMMLEHVTASAYVYERADETVLVELRMKEIQETKAIGGTAQARSLAASASLSKLMKYEREPELFAVIAGIPFYEVFDTEGQMLGHYRTIYARIGLDEEVRLIVHVNAGKDAAKDILGAIDFENPYGLLRIPMSHVANDFVFGDAKSGRKFGSAVDFIHTKSKMNLTIFKLGHSSAGRAGLKIARFVEKYGSEPSMRDMYIMEHRDAVQALAQIENLGETPINLNDLIEDAVPIEAPIQKADVKGQTGSQDAALQAVEEPEVVKPTMSATLLQELDASDRKVVTHSKPQKEASALAAPIKAAKPAASAEKAKKIRVNRLGGNKKVRRNTAKRGGCGGGSFCKVSN